MIVQKNDYKLIIYKADRIGDFVLAIGAIRLLVDKFGHENVLVLVSPVGVSLMDHFFKDVEYRVIRCPFPDRLRYHPFQFLKEFRFISSLRADHVVCLNHYKQEAMYLLEYGLRTNTLHRCVSPLSEDRFRDLLPGSFPYPDSADLPYNRELIAHHHVVQEAIGIELDLESILPVLTSGSGGGIIVSPFGTSSVRNLSPKQVTWAIGKSSLTDTVFLVGEESRLAELEVFKSGLIRAGIAKDKVFCQTCNSLSKFIKKVDSADFVISTETATAHFAAAMGKPGIGFLGGGHFGFFAPWGKGPFNWVYKEMDCFGCGWKCIHPEVRCLDELP